MSSTTLVSYDQIPYNSGPFRQTHPCHAAVLPILFGLQPPPVRGCRVLELGCAAGGNLIPMAQDLPESEFFGIDLSARQIEDGQSLLAELRLENIQLRHMSILDVDESLGEFDYILCHGVYSWVPREVQEKILAIGARNLKPGGLCYVSYNTYPGWHLRGVVRDMMQYHVAPFDDPQTKISQARVLLEFLNQSKAPRSEAYRRLLQDEARLLNQHADSYLFHEHLEENNEPCYFHEFVERARRAGLQYLAESDFSTMLAENFDEPTARILRDASLLRQEQYMDFLRNRMFRETLLCHAGVPIDRTVVAARLRGCHVALDERLPLDNAGLDSAEPWSLALGRETITASQPITKAALLVLNDVWPAALAADDLYAAASARAAALPPPPSRAERAASDLAILASDLLTLYAHGLLRAYLDPPPIAARAGGKPQTTALARLQARRGNLVTNRRHETFRLTDLSRALLARLDGRHDRGALTEWLAGAIGRGEFSVRRGEERLASVDQATLEQILEAALASLADSALLVA